MPIWATSLLCSSRSCCWAMYCVFPIFKSDLTSLFKSLNAFRAASFAANSLALSSLILSAVCNLLSLRLAASISVSVGVGASLFHFSSSAFSLICDLSASANSSLTSTRERTNGIIFSISLSCADICATPSCSSCCFAIRSFQSLLYSSVDLGTAASIASLVSESASLNTVSKFAISDFTSSRSLLMASISASYSSFVIAPLFRRSSALASESSSSFSLPCSDFFFDSIPSSDFTSDFSPLPNSPSKPRNMPLSVSMAILTVLLTFTPTFLPPLSFFVVFTESISARSLMSFLVSMPTITSSTFLIVSSSLVARLFLSCPVPSFAFHCLAMSRTLPTSALNSALPISFASIGDNSPLMYFTSDFAKSETFSLFDLISEIFALYLARMPVFEMSVFNLFISVVMLFTFSVSPLSVASISLELRSASFSVNFALRSFSTATVFLALSSFSLSRNAAASPFATSECGLPERYSFVASARSFFTMSISAFMSSEVEFFSSSLFTACSISECLLS